MRPPEKWHGVLEDYLVLIASDTASGGIGYVRHVVRREGGGSTETPVGFFFACVAELSDIRPYHWELQIFLSAGVHYDVEHRISQPVAPDAPQPEPPHYAAELPEAIGRFVLDHTHCEEPMALLVNHYRGVDVLEFGETWLDE